MNLSLLVEQLSKVLEQKKMMLATAESCTGGLIAKLMTDRAGSSAVFERGFVTYSNDAKTELLGVSSQILKTHGAVSAETAENMARGALKNSKAQLAVSVTGVAGPTGGTSDKPVGLVYIGIADQDYIGSFECHFEGNRESIRTQTAEKALTLLLNHITH